MKRISLCLFLFVLIANTGYALDVWKSDDEKSDLKVHVTSQAEMTHNEVTGPGAANSFLYYGNKGISYEDRLDILSRLTLGDVLYESDLDTRFTNNERIDTEDVSVKKFYLMRKSPYDLFQAGDFFANFSQYSLNQNLKGTLFSLLENETNPWDVSLVWGISKSRWEHVFGDIADELKDTHFTGMRAGRKVRSFEGHINYVWTHEEKLGDPDGVNTGRSTAEVGRNHVASFDWSFRPVSGLDLSGESAVSRYKRKNIVRNDDDIGFADKVRGRFRIKDLRTQMEYERTPSDFHTLGGSASADREGYRIRNNYYLGDVDLFANYTTYWDNTQNSLTQTTKTKIPELGATIPNFLKRKTLTNTISWRQNRRHRSSNTLDERTDTYLLSLEDKFGPFRPIAEYEFRRVDPRKDITDGGERTNAMSLKINSYHRLKDLTIRPFASARWEETEDYGLPAQRGNNIDTIWSGGLNGGFKRDLRFDLSYTRSEADNYIANSDTRRGAFRASLDYDVGGNQNDVIGIEYNANRNSFSQGVSDYNEKILKLKWTKKF